MHKTKQGYHFRLLKLNTQNSMILYYYPLSVHLDFAAPQLLLNSN